MIAIGTTLQSTLGLLVFWLGIGLYKYQMITVGNVVVPSIVEHDFVGQVQVLIRCVCGSDEWDGADYCRSSRRQLERLMPLLAVNCHSCCIGLIALTRAAVVITIARHASRDR